MVELEVKPQVEPEIRLKVESDVEPEVKKIQLVSPGNYSQIKLAGICKKN